jgi:uncharacterized coiled-coil protein SlyX
VNVSPEVVTGAGVVLAATVTAYMTSRTLKRTTSGDVARSTAADMWAAADKFQGRTLARIDSLEAAANMMQKTIDELRMVVTSMTATDVQKTAVIAELHTKINELESTMRTMRDKLAEMRAGD